MSMKFNTHMSAKEFYFRSFTWGLPVNIGGAVVALAMLATGHKPQKYGNCIHFDVGDNWGGGSCGVFIFTGKNVPEKVKQHEAGHSLQNCYYGPLMPLLVNLPSTTRFLVRGALEKLLPGSVKTDYYSVWFENQASRLGTEYMKNIQAAEQQALPEDQERL